MMYRNVLLKGMLAMALVFGLVLTGCPTETKEEEKDSWSDVTSLSQLDGTWKGSASQTIILKELFGEQYWTDNGYETIIGPDAKALVTTARTYNFNTSAETMSEATNITMTFSGSKINAPDAPAWLEIKTTILGPSFNYDDIKHTATLDSSPHEQPLPSLEEIKEWYLPGLQINQKGTKLKMPASGGSPEVIFTK